ncbi:MAG: hypothetical protein IT427_13825 [Pirellulales bacterium]|nr:hypothetical protein [Pirellulales bacterium]
MALANVEKREIQQVLDHFSDEVDPEPLMQNLSLKMKLERAEEALAEGCFISYKELVHKTNDHAARRLPLMQDEEIGKIQARSFIYGY